MYIKSTTHYNIREMAKRKITKPTLYELLQVRDNASSDVIHAAWRARAAQVHPDNGGSSNLAAKVNEAKEVLLDKNKRKGYDAALDKVIGNYRVVREIAEGAFGVTYEAEHLVLGEKACIKQSLEVSPEHNALLKKEAQLLWGIHHYALPTLRDFVDCGDGSLALIMSYVEGPNLFDIVQSTGGLDTENVSWMTQRLLNALHYLHFSGIVHGDVKPQNIIIKPEEHNAVLVDYGLSVKNSNHKTAPEGYTPMFAAPESLDGKPPLPESDLYSLGASMIYSLGGDPSNKTYPKRIPGEFIEFYDSLVKYNPMDRPNWEKGDLIKKLSNIRQKVFGRRHSNSILNIDLKGGKRK
jgi:serine/threonine protein kinase